MRGRRHDVLLHLLALSSSSAGEQSKTEPHLPISVRHTAADLDALGGKGRRSRSRVTAEVLAKLGGKEERGEGSGRRPELGGAPASRAVRRRQRSSSGLRGWTVFEIPSTPGRLQPSDAACAMQMD